MGDYAELDPTPGGGYVVDINGVPIRGSFVEIVLSPDGAGTIVQLALHDLPADELSKHDTGWGHFLARLIVAAAGGDPGPDPLANP